MVVAGADFVVYLTVVGLFVELVALVVVVGELVTVVVLSVVVAVVVDVVVGGAVPFKHFRNGKSNVAELTAKIVGWKND